jgi:phospholipid/cholesterol/gamma-HCH transport system ATP-binding protein
MIEARSIYKQFEGKTVLDDINATFNNGITNLIIGQSGAGKTVFLKCIVGLLTPDKGQIIYDGRCVTTLKEKEKISIRREIGMLFQSAALFDSMSVLENVMFPLDMFSNMTSLEKLVLSADFSFDGDGKVTTAGYKAYLPAPNNAEGVWYDEEGKPYAPSDIPQETVGTYYAVNPVQP